MLLHALIFKRFRLGVLAASVAGLFFVSWEGFIFLRAGHSHFLTQSEVYGSVHLLAKYAYLAWPIVTIMGAVAPFFALLAFASLGVSKRTLALATTLIVVGYLMLALKPEASRLPRVEPGQSFAPCKGSLRIRRASF
jgi:hypothetical protein